MATSIEELSISIEAKAQSANTAIDRLVGKLDRLSASLGRLDTSNLKNLSSGINDLSSAMNGLGEKNVSGFSSIVSAFSRITKIDTAKIKDLADSVSSLTSGMGNITFDSSKITEVASAVSRLGGKNATQAIENLTPMKNAISDFVTGLNGVGTINFDSASLANLASSLSKIGGKNATQAITNLRPLKEELVKFVNGLNGLGGLNFNIAEISELVSSISRMGGKAATNAIKNIPKLADAVKELMKTLSTAPKVSQNLINMTNAIARLARTGASAGRAAESLGRSFSVAGNYSKNFSKALSAVSGNVKSFSRQILSSLGIATGIYGIFRGIKESIDISSSLTEVQNVVDTTFADMSYKVEDFAKTSIEQFGMSELSLKQYASRFQAMGTAMNIDTSSIEQANEFLSKQTGGYIGLSDSMSDVSLNLTKLTADMASFYNVEQKAVAEDLEAIFTGQTRPLRTYGLDLTEATLQEWAMKNGLDANIQSMSQVEKTMLRYQYVLANTGAAQGDFSKTANTWANQTRILKQNLEALASVIGGTLINALKPLVSALNAAMSHIIAFAETISNALGKIFGWTFETTGGGMAQDFDDAAVGAEDIADSTGTAAKNIDKMKAGLRAFDELKAINLPTATDTSGGGGSGAGGAVGGASAAGGQWLQTESIIDQYKSDIDTLYQLGSYISKALIDSMESINWDSVYEKARGFGKGLADFLNGIFAGQNGITLFGEVGKTIANSLNTVIYAALSFGETFDFEQFGKNIADGINNFFRNFDFGSFAETLNVWVDGLIDSIKGFLMNLDFGAIFSGLGEFFGNLDLDTLFLGLIVSAPLAISAIQNIGTAFSNLQNIFAVFFEWFAGTGLGESLLEMFSLWSGGAGTLGEAFMAVFGPAGIITLALSGLAVGLGYVFATNEQVRESFLNAVSAIQDNLQPAIDLMTNTVLPDLKAAWDKLIEILTPFGNFLKEMFTSVWQDMINPALTYIGETVLPLVTGAFENLWNNVLVPFGSFIADVLEPIIKIISDVLTILWKNVVVPLAQAIGNVLGKAFKGLADIFNKTVVPILNKVISVFQFLWNNVFEPIVSFLWSTLKPVFETVFNAIKGIIDGLSKAFGGLIDFVVGVFTLDWKKAWNGIKDVFKGIFNGLISIVEGVVNLIIGGLNKFLGKFNGIVTSIGDLIGVDISVPVISKISIPRFEQGGFPIPKPYSLFAAGEGGVPELLGTVGGKTAVAGGEEITGIRDAIYSMHQDEVRYFREQNEILRGILQKEFGITEKEIGRAAANYSRDYMSRTGKPAYTF